MRLKKGDLCRAKGTVGRYVRYGLCVYVSAMTNDPFLRRVSGPAEPGDDRWPAPHDKAVHRAWLWAGRFGRKHFDETLKDGVCFAPTVRDW